MSSQNNHGKKPSAFSVTESNSHNSNTLSKNKYTSADNLQFQPETLEKASIALNFIPNDLAHEDWLKVATALKTEFSDSAKEAFLAWSDNGKRDDKSNAIDTWRSIQTGRATIKTLYYYARKHGYTEEIQQVSSADDAKQRARNEERKAEQAKREEKEKQRKAVEQKRAKNAISEVLNYLAPATPNATLYLKEKQSDGCGAYILHASDIQKTSTAKFTYPFNEIRKGALCIPFQNENGEYVGAQLIYGSKKRNIKGSIKKGAYAFAGLAPLPKTTKKIYISEGYSTINSVLQADKKSFGVMAVDAGNLPLVAESIRGRYQNANVIILGDNDKSGAGQAKAKEAGQYANNVIIPQWIDGQVKNTDFNDIHVMKGLNALKKALNLMQSVEYSDCCIPDNIASDYYEDLAPITDHLLTPEQHGFYPNNLVINQRYLGYALAEALKDHRCLGVHSTFGTGKTYAIKKIIKKLEKKLERLPRILFVTPRKSLNKAISEDFCDIIYYEDVKGQSIEKVRELAGSMASTPQSLGAIIDKLDSYFAYDLIIFDESETIAQALVSKTTNDKAKAILALKKVVSACKSVVFMDANYSKNSETFAQIITGLGHVPVLENTNQHWKKIKAIIIEGGNFSGRKDVINTQIITALKKGKKIGVASSSATYCNDIYDILQIRLPQLRGKLCTSQSDYSDLMKNPLGVKKYDYVIYSPSMSIGVSFDIKNCFEEAFGVFANDIATPDSHDAMQAMARFRHLVGNKWTITLDDEKRIYSHGSSSIEMCREIQRAYIDSFNRNVLFSKSDRLMQTIDLELINLFSVLEASRRVNKNNFNKSFLTNLKEMGVTIIKLNPEESIRIDESIKKDIKENKEATKEQAIQAIFNAEKINDDAELERLTALRHFGKTTKQENLMLERAYTEKSFNVDFDIMDDSEKREVLDFKNDGFINKAIRREKQSASKELDKAFVKSGLDGLDNEHESGKKDVLHKKHNYLLEKKLHKYALPYIDGKEYSHKILKRTGFWQWVMTNKKEVSALIPNFIPATFKDSPAKLMNKLLANLGYSHTSSQSRNNNKKREYIYRVMLNASFERFIKDRVERGAGWDEFTENLFIELESRKELLSKKDITSLQMPVVDIKFALEKLKLIPRINHAKVMKIYKEKYDTMNPKNRGIDSPIFANSWLESQVKIA